MHWSKGLPGLQSLSALVGRVTMASHTNALAVSSIPGHSGFLSVRGKEFRNLQTAVGPPGTAPFPPTIILAAVV